MESLSWIEGLVEDFVARSPANRVPELGMLQIFEHPLVAVAAADDPLFSKLKEPGVVGPRHMSPREWLPEARAVISYFLPFSPRVREANRGPGLPAVEWLYGRIEGEAFNDALRGHIVDALRGIGEKAVAPVLDSRFSVVDKRSNWSERHVAFIAGLGTFGLSKSLITKRGCAGRYGSVVTSLALSPSPRQYEDPFEYCPGVISGGCGECVARCPSGAITARGKDTPTCSRYLDSEIKPRFAPRYGCGKCQTNVPCEFGLPA